MTIDQIAQLGLSSLKVIYYLEQLFKGRWLEQTGFYAGLPVVIKVEQNKLIIELASKF